MAMTAQLSKRLAWLAGVMDSDGSVGISLSGRGVYVVQVQITNTDHRLLDRARGVYEALGVRYRVGLLTNGTKNAKHARALNLCVGRFEDVVKLLAAIGPFMVSKFDRAALAAEFCRLRISAKCGPYGAREHEIYAQMKHMQTAYKVYGGENADG
jgi:hypothetical protein